MLQRRAMSSVFSILDGHMRMALGPFLLLVQQAQSLLLLIIELFQIALHAFLMVMP